MDFTDKMQKRRYSGSLQTMYLVRIICPFSVEVNLMVHQMDVVAAYNNGELNEEIYMEHPEGFNILL